MQQWQIETVLATSPCTPLHCRALQVLAWALIDDHQRSVDSLEQALGTIVPQRLADTNVKVEELQTRYNALKQGAEEKVGGVLAQDEG